MQPKRALIVGIDHYSRMPLTGCVADAQEMAALLRRNSDGSKNYDVHLVVSEKGKPRISRQELRGLLRKKLFDESKGMHLLFYFSGHGARSSWGSELVLQDYPTTHDGVSVDDLITLANASPAVEVVIILDCCFGGETGDLKGIQADGIADEFRFGRAVLREGVTILTASRPAEVSMEEEGHGVFTKLLLEGLEGGAADNFGNVTALRLYDFASRAFNSFEQRPMLKSHVVSPSLLRTCPSAITRETFQSILEHFPDPNSKVRLSKKHEGTRPIPRGVRPTPEQLAFDCFKELRNTGLLATEDNLDLYYVAMKSKHVFLTPRGQYFWRLAQKDRG